MAEKQEKEEQKDKKIESYGQVLLGEDEHNGKIQLMTIIGEIEGHDVLPAASKTTKYVGGDVSAGLALAEMIASMKTPSVSLVLGDSHSIGVPLAVSTDYSFIAPTATMIVHPVRMNGTIIGAPQTFDYFQLIQDRIVHFIAGHSRVEKEKLEQMMINTGMLTKDLGTILVGKEAVRQGLIDEVGGISAALEKLRSLMAD